MITLSVVVAGERTPGARKRHLPDPYEPFVEYVTARLAEDPHLWAQTLMDELEPLGFPLSYQSRLAAEPYNSLRYMSCEYDYFDTVK
ncbi:hypothetical protein V5F01_18650 [Streptomyces sp. NRRL B-2790]|uniref:hypothetical protein n=1 Tax=Streptomyces sp. NRRL B-2790 TaxID=1463835 RepID=UPI003563816A